MTPTERAILKQLRSGDPTGIDVLYARFGAALFGFALRLTGSRTLAEDLTQEVFLAAWAGHDTFQGSSTLHSWLLGIAVRRWRDQSRRASPNTTALDETIAESVPQAGALLADAVTDRVVLTDAIGALALPYREALLLVIGQGLTYREAAAVLGIPVGTAKWRVSDATRQLRRVLGETFQEGGTENDPSGQRDTATCHG